MPKERASRSYTNIAEMRHIIDNGDQDVALVPTIAILWAPPVLPSIHHLLSLCNNGEKDDGDDLETVAIMWAF